MPNYISSVIILILLANFLIWGIVLGIIFYAKRHNSEGSCRFYKSKGFWYSGTTINSQNNMPNDIPNDSCDNSSSSSNDFSNDSSSSDQDSY